MFYGYYGAMHLLLLTQACFYKYCGALHLPGLIEISRAHPL